MAEYKAYGLVTVALRVTIEQDNPPSHQDFIKAMHDLNVSDCGRVDCTDAFEFNVERVVDEE
jgi:hypothetical protein